MRLSTSPRWLACACPSLARAAALAMAGVLAVPVLVGVIGATWPAAAASRQAGGLRAACPSASPGFFRCLALYRPEFLVNRALAAGRASNPVGLSARQIERAYRLPVRRRSHQLVAVSIAFNAPHLAQDLAVYRSHFGLPPCTTASGCLRIVNQQGKAGPLPGSGVPSGWALEETLDVSMISVACPSCRILVVEANSPSLGDLGATENTAARLGAQVISNSYATPESSFLASHAAPWVHPGHAIVAASGDFGFTTALFPADLATVTAVGGTQLSRAPGTRRGWAERVWKTAGQGASGSGCSAFVAKPAWQHSPRCPGRTIADVSAVAVNVPVYSRDFGGWVTVAGTSIAAPLVAGIYGLAGNAAVIRPGYAYAHRRGHLFDITKGNNTLGASPQQQCGADYECVARPGYDGPSGLGTPDGTGAF